jgi:cell division protease FtsH
MKMLAASYEEAKSILSRNMDALHRIAAYLIEKETITGKEFMEIYRREKGLPDPAEEKASEEKAEDKSEAKPEENSENAPEAVSEEQPEQVSEVKSETVPADIPETEDKPESKEDENV